MGLSITLCATTPVLLHSRPSLLLLSAHPALTFWDLMVRPLCKERGSEHLRVEAKRRDAQHAAHVARQVVRVQLRPYADSLSCGWISETKLLHTGRPGAYCIAVACPWRWSKTLRD
jgi:hypothetical protein